MVIESYAESMESEWDTFVYSSSSGTFLHTRRFLSYHGERFTDCSLMVRDDKGDIIAVFPAALLPSDQTIVVSHPGITYGGILGGNKCRGDMMVQVLRSICDYYRNMGGLKLQYRVVPSIYHSSIIQDDLYALFRIGAVKYRCDLSSTIDLHRRGEISSRRKRGYKKAVKSGVTIKSGLQYASEIWNVLSSNLESKYDTKPVHSLDEIIFLHKRFPENIQFIAALYQGRVESAVVLFQSTMVSHAQYIASSDIGYAINALDMVFEYCIDEAKVRYFDFGTSNEDSGKVLNTGLYDFKSGFGAGSSVYEFYEVNLRCNYAS